MNISAITNLLSPLFQKQIVAQEEVSEPKADEREASTPALADSQIEASAGFETVG